jgi:hypothetical protein
MGSGHSHNLHTPREWQDFLSYSNCKENGFRQEFSGMFGNVVFLHTTKNIQHVHRLEPGALMMP